MFTPRSRFIIVFMAISVLLTVFPLAAQVNPPAKNYPLKKLNGLPTTGVAEFSSWTVTSPTMSHVIYRTIDYSTSQMKVKQYKLSSTGAFASLGNDLHTTNGWVGYCHSAWIADSGAPAGSGTVMVFIPANRDAEGTVMDLYMVGINPANGQQVIPKKNIFSFKAPAGQTIHEGQVRVKKEGNTIAVVIAIMLDRKANPYNYSFAGKLYYLELNSAGYLRGQAKMVKVPNGGILQEFNVGTPAHNGRGWIVPIYHLRYKTISNAQGMGTQPVGNSLYILTATGATYASTKLKMRRLFSDNQELYYSFRSAFLLPSAKANRFSYVDPTGVKGLTLDMFFVHRSLVPQSKMKLDQFTSTYGIVPINDKGKKAGQVTSLDIPEWNHRMIYDPAKELVIYSDAVSNIVQSKDGRFCISQSRFLFRGEPDAYSLSDYESEQEFNYYKFDRSTGKVEHYARTARSWLALVFNPEIRMMSGKVIVLNHLYSYTNAMWESYFSLFKP